MSILKHFFEKKKIREEKIHAAREGYVSWMEISRSKGWVIYEQAIEKKIEIISKRLCEDSTLDGESMVRLRLALAVWREVKRLPKELEEKANSK